MILSTLGAVGKVVGGGRQVTETEGCEHLLVMKSYHEKKKHRKKKRRYDDLNCSTE